MASSGGYHLLALAMSAYELSDVLIHALCQLVGGDLCAALEKGNSHQWLACFFSLYILRFLALVSFLCAIFVVVVMYDALEV